MDPIKIKRNILEDLIRHALTEWPLECCGLLSGVQGVISRLHRMNNTLNSTKSFFMDPEELIAVFKEIRMNGSVHLGIYHSHPASEPFPSRRDIEEAYYPACPFFIVSLKSFKSPLLKAFSLSENRVVEWPLEILG
jgi:[CysO sulfur-carrier protein]-S-L-cysteine hydrolase